MLMLDDCDSHFLELNVSQFDLADWFTSADDFQRYYFQCYLLACANHSVAENAACPATMDRLAGGCWPHTTANEVATIACPGHIIKFHTNRLAHRTCGADGVWRNMTYSQCIAADEITFVKVLLCYVGGSLSITSCLCALAILQTLKVLRCGRVTLHKHFFVSNIGYSACWILKFALLELAMHDAPGWCHLVRVVEVLTAYFTVTNIVWMFSEGLFLYAHVVLGFVREDTLLNACLLLGWGLAVAPTGVFITRAAMLTASGDNDWCWALVMSDSIVNHSVMAPIALALLANLYFLVHIVVTLWVKMRGVTQQTRETNQMLKAVRAVLILFPLLGTQQLILVTQPDQNSDLYPAYEIVSMILTSCQGTFVASLFCFANGEVIAALKRKSPTVRLLLLRLCSSDDEAVSAVATLRNSLPSNCSPAGLDQRRVANEYSRLGVKRPPANPNA